MSDNQNLNKARSEKNDEFYTQYSDVEKELSHYANSKQFAGKTVYCNCDDPDRSEFWNYFVNNFELLGLKRIIATCCTRGGMASMQSLTGFQPPAMN